LEKLHLPPNREDSLTVIVAAVAWKFPEPETERLLLVMVRRGIWPITTFPPLVRRVVFFSESSFIEPEKHKKSLDMKESTRRGAFGSWKVHMSVAPMSPIVDSVMGFGPVYANVKYPGNELPSAMSTIRQAVDIVVVPEESNEHGLDNGQLPQDPSQISDEYEFKYTS
jgi:hypothetical protein